MRSAVGGHLPTPGPRSAVATVAVAMAAAVCGAMWALTSPLGSSPDDNYHQATIWCVDATTSTAPCRVVGESGTTGGRVVEIPALVANPSCYAFQPTESAACQGPLRDQVVTTETLDNGTYPGGFYRAMHLLVRDSIPESVLSMRMANAALGAALLGAIALVTTAAVRRLMVLTLAPVLIPLGWFVLGSVNPSSWALSGLTAFGFALHTLFLVERGFLVEGGFLVDRGRRVAVGVLGVVSLTLALSARGDAPVYAGVITVAICLLHWGTLWARKGLLAVPVLVAAVCLWRVLVAAQVASIAGASAETERSLGEVVPNLMLEFPALFSGMFGYSFGLGWLDTPVHSVTAYPVALVIGFLVLSGLGRMSIPKALAASVIFLPMLVVPMMTLVRTRLIVGESVQPRYLLPLMPMLLAVLLTDTAVDRVVWLSRVQAVLIWLALTAAAAAALYANVRRYVTGVDGPIMIGDLEWWWQSGPSPGAVVALGAAAYAVFSAPLVIMHWRHPSPSWDSASEPTPAVTRAVTLETA